VSAGVRYEGRVEAGGAVKICSGAPIPDGADAVVSGEFCEEVASGEKLHISQLYASGCYGKYVDFVYVLGIPCDVCP